jgi:transcriptional regulator with XRE-family HTH domain
MVETSQPTDWPDGGDRSLTRTFLREWRTYRGLNLREFSEAVGLSAGRMSQIEQGKDPYHQRLLERCAEKLECRPADILLGDPRDRAIADPARVAALQKRAHILSVFIEQLQELCKQIAELTDAPVGRQSPSAPDSEP